MNQDAFIRLALDGTATAVLSSYKKMGRIEKLQFIRGVQEQLSRYAKNHAQDEVQIGAVRHLQVMETVCRRYDVLREIRRRRNDPKFLKILDHNKRVYGPPGCQYPEYGEAALFGFRTGYRCSQPKCNHLGANKAIKWLKRVVNDEWQRLVLDRFKY